jgi:HSP20 family protein
MASQHEKEFVRNFLGMHRQMERFLNDVCHYGGRPAFTGDQSWSPPVDVFQTEDGFIVKAEVAGLDLDDLEVSFEDGRLTIEGTRHEACPKASVICHQMEIPYGHFRRTISVSKEVDGERITADYEAGFLEIHLPRSKSHGRKKVQIKVE